MNNPIDDPSEFDFYISANRESAAAQEVAQVLRETGYSIYMPARNNEEGEADRFAANRSKAIVLVLTKDAEQTQIDLDELLNILSIGGAERRVIVLQFEECEIARLLDRSFITNLVGLNTHDRAIHILASAAQSPKIILPVEATRPLPLGASAQRAESQPYSDWTTPADDPEISASSEEPAELRAPGVRRVNQIFPVPPISPKLVLEEVAAPDVVSRPRLDETGNQTREATTHSHNDKEEALHTPRKTPEETDIVEFGVSHPTSVTIGIAFIVDVLIYCQDDRLRAVERSAELRPENDRFGSAGATQVARGTKLSVTLELPWPIEPKIQSVYWNGSMADVSFRVWPTNLVHTSVYGVCKISVDGLTIGHVFFKLGIDQSNTPDERKMSWARPVKTAFASYTSKDRRRVLARVQGIEKLGVKVFMDTHGLRSNEAYRKRIFEAIDSSDILYLFWSRHATRSNWVEQEWRYGVRQKGLGFIDPVPLVDPRKAPPPAELAQHKHFIDLTLIYSEYEKSLGTWARIRSWLAD